jgi:predicted lipid-binding transport protein (Tim44 family)
MKWILGFYGIQLIILIILVIGSWFIWDRRFKAKNRQQVPKGFVRTNEVSFDPTTNKKLVVYFNQETGERFYKEE